jgi:hypothetical protein
MPGSRSWKGHHPAVGLPPERRGVAAHGDDVKHTPKSVQSEPAGAGRGLIPKRLGCFGGCGSEMA